MKTKSRPQYYRIRRVLEMVREGTQSGYLANSSDFKNWAFRAAPWPTEKYEKHLRTLITSWRNLWGRGDFAFYPDMIIIS